jgi:pyruvate/2-oxoglutarate dehydrogenase complex dihydrolipoamide acyltransferase (E2) component
MSLEVKIPAVGESVTSGMISSWLKSDGDVVNKGDALFTLETDKVSTEVTADAAGTLRIKAQAGADVKIGEVVATIEEGSAAPAKKPQGAPEPLPPTTPSPAGVANHPPVSQKARAKLQPPLLNPPRQLARRPLPRAPLRFRFRRQSQPRMNRSVRSRRMRHPPRRGAVPGSDSLLCGGKLRLSS